MSKLDCSNCKYYDFNAYDGADYCALNKTETGICGNCEREFEDLEEATEHYNAKEKECQSLYKSNWQLTGKMKETQAELEKYKIKDTVGLAQFINENSIKLAIAELEKVKEQFSGCHLNGNSQKSVSLSRLYKIINSQIKNLKERSHE